MTYITGFQASKKSNISIRRIQQMCKSGEIIGAKKNR